MGSNISKGLETKVKLTCNKAEIMVSKLQIIFHPSQQLQGNFKPADYYIQKLFLIKTKLEKFGTDCARDADLLKLIRVTQVRVNDFIQSNDQLNKAHERVLRNDRENWFEEKLEQQKKEGHMKKSVVKGDLRPSLGKLNDPSDQDNQKTQKQRASSQRRATPEKTSQPDLKQQNKRSTSPLKEQSKQEHSSKRNASREKENSSKRNASREREQTKRQPSREKELALGKKQSSVREYEQPQKQSSPTKEQKQSSPTKDQKQIFQPIIDLLEPQVQQQQQVQSAEIVQQLDVLSPPMSSQKEIAQFRSYTKMHLPPHPQPPKEEVQIPPPIVETQQANQDTIDEDQLCKICLENKKSHAAVPCGHFIYCGQCKSEVMKKKKCFLCKQKVTSFMKVFT